VSGEHLFAVHPAGAGHLNREVCSSIREDAQGLDTLGLRGRAAHTESMSNLHSRISAGVPSGGQFATTAHGEPDIALVLQFHLR